MNTDEFGGVAVDPATAPDAETRARMVKAGLFDEFGGVPVNTDEFGGVAEDQSVPFVARELTPSERFARESVEYHHTRSPEEIGNADFLAATHGDPVLAVPLAIGAKILGSKNPEAAPFKPLVTLPHFDDEAMSVLGPTGKKLATAYNAVMDDAQGLTTPETLVQLPFGANKGMQIAFLGQMAGHFPDLAENVADAKTPEERITAWTHLTTTAVMAGMLGKGTLKGGKAEAGGRMSEGGTGKIPVEWRELKSAPVDEFGGIPVEPVATEAKPIKQEVAETAEEPHVTETSNIEHSTPNAEVAAEPPYIPEGVKPPEEPATTSAAVTDTPLQPEPATGTVALPGEPAPAMAAELRTPNPELRSPTDRPPPGVPMQTFERPHDILDDIESHAGGVRIPDAADFDYVREAFKELSQSKAADLGGAKLKSLFRGTEANDALDALHREGVWRNVETPDELFSRMIGAAKARVEWARQEKSAKNFKPDPAREDARPTEEPDWAVGDVGPMDYVGMGGATPSEFETNKGLPTSMKNAAVDIERGKRGLPPAMEPARRSFGEVWDKANAQIDQDPSSVDRLVDELRTKPRALTDTEDAMLLQQQISLQNQYGRMTRELAQAYEDAKEFPNRADAAADLKLRTAKLSDDLLDLYNINKTVGTETGRGLAARRMLAYEDFSLAKMELERRAANGGRPLTEVESAEVQKLHDKIATTQKAFDEYVAKADAERAERQVADEINERIKQVEKTPGHDRNVLSLADRIVGALEKEADKARVRLKERLKRTSAGVDPTLLGDLAIVGAAKIARGTLDKSRWLKEMVADFGEEIIPWLNTAWEKSNQRLDDAVTRVAKGKTAIAVKRAVRKEDVTGQRESIIEGLRSMRGGQQTAATLQELGPYVRKLAENFIRSGLKDRDALINAVHDVLTKEVDPNLTRRQAMDAISGYGDFKPLNPDQVKVQLRELKGQMQQVAKLEDIQAKQPLKKTGLERRVPGDEERRLIQQVNEAKRRFGVVTTDPASQLKSALDAIKTRLQNQIKDLQFQIDTKEKIVRTKTATPFDAEATRLKMERDELKAKYDEVFTKPGLTDAQRAQRAMQSVKSSIEEYERRIASKDISRATSRTPETPELAAARARRDALRSQFEDLRDANEDYQREQAARTLQAQKTALEQAIKAREEQLRTGPKAPETRMVNRPADPLIEQLLQRREELNRQLAEARNPKKTPEQRALAALKTRLQNRTVELQDRLGKADFTARPRRTITLDAEAERLKAEMLTAKQAFQRALITDRLKQRPWFIKGQDTFLKWRRGFLLSSPITLAKLTSAAAQRLLFTPIEEGIGGVYSKLLPGLADRAPREGGLNVNAEAKALTEGFVRGMKDSWDQLRTGQSQMDVLYGKGREGSIGESDVAPRSVMDFFGQLHAALKAPAKRGEFARSFEKRMAWNLRKGIDVREPAVQTRIAVEAYKDANRTIFLQDNRVVSAYKRALTAFEQKDKAGNVSLGGKLAATTARTLLPIVRVPTNIVAETFQYALGSVSGSVRLGVAMRKGIETLRPEEADLIMRHLKKGSLGAAMLLAGYFMPNAVGGYYQPGQKRDKADVPVGGLRIGGTTVPTYLLHNPLLETLQLGATIRRVADSKLHKKDTDTQGIPAGAAAAALGLTEEVPFVRETMDLQKLMDPHTRGVFIGEMGKSIAVPQLVQWLARQGDKDAAGDVNARRAKTSWQQFQTGVPLLRRNVPLADVPIPPVINHFFKSIKGGTHEIRESMKQSMARSMATNAPAAKR